MPALPNAIAAVLLPVESHQAKMSRSIYSLENPSVLRNRAVSVGVLGVDNFLKVQHVSFIAPAHLQITVVLVQIQNVVTWVE